VARWFFDSAVAVRAPASRGSSGRRRGGDDIRRRHVTGFDYSDSLRDAVRRSSLIDRPLRASNRLVGGGEIRRIRAEPIPVLGSQRAGDVSHKPGGRLPLLSAGPAVTLATLKRAATNFAAW